MTATPTTRSRTSIEIHKKSGEDLGPVLELRRQLRASNKAKTFRASESTAQTLRTQRESKIQTALQMARSKLEQDLATTFADYHSVRAQLNAEFGQREQCLRESINDSFEAMRERHLEALTALALSTSAETQRAMKWTTSEFRELERIAVVLADHEEFAAASQTVRDARAVQSRSQTEKAFIVRKSSEAARRHLLVQFEKDAEKLAENLAQGIAGIKDQKEAEIVIQQRQCSAAVQRQMQAVIHEAVKNIGKKELEVMVTVPIKRFVRWTAQENGMNWNLGFDSLAN
jgi:hypothetical protein